MNELIVVSVREELKKRLYGRVNVLLKDDDVLYVSIKDVKFDIYWHYNMYKISEKINAGMSISNICEWITKKYYDFLVDHIVKARFFRKEA